MKSIADKSTFLQAVRRLALVGAVVAAISGCASPGTSPDSYDLVLNAPGLETVQPKVVGILGDYSETVERSTWNASHATWPQADLYFWRIKELFKNSQSYIHESSLPEMIETVLPSENITFGAVGRSKNVMGELQFQRFRRGQFAECIFIVQGISRYSDQDEVIGSGESLGDMVIDGWYCVDPTEPNQEAAFQGFMAGIGIAGWSHAAGVSPQRKIQSGNSTAYIDHAEKSDKDICDGMRYGNPGYVDEANRRQLTSETCR